MKARVYTAYTMYLFIRFIDPHIISSDDLVLVCAYVHVWDDMVEIVYITHMMVLEVIY